MAVPERRRRPTAATRPAVREPPSERRLFADGRFFTPDGRARFVVDDPVPVTESDRRPATRSSLLTGRGSSSQWHTGTRTAKSAVLRTLAPESAYVEIAPDRRRRHSASRPSDWVVVESARGSMRARALVTADRAGRPGVRAHARRRHQPADLPVVRPALPPAVVQDRRGRRPPPAPLGALTATADAR